MDPQKPVPMTGVLGRRTQAVQQVHKAVQGAETQPRPPETGSLLLHYTGLGDPCFDDQGMVLPHSILGNLEDFKRYLETQGDKELVRCIPQMKGENLPEALAGEHASTANEKDHGLSASHRNIQNNALQHWRTHMRRRRQQQDFLSKSLHRPMESLLMNQTNLFRKVQEQRELLSMVLPAIQPGHGYRVGSEFWSQPDSFGDEVSGITATLTRTQRGNQEPVIRVGQPSTVQQESGNVGTCRPTTRAWNQSEYLKRQQEELQHVLKTLDFETPDLDGLEVIGSGKPVSHVSVYGNPLLEEENKQEQLDPLVQDDNLVWDAVLIPALKFCGHSARWMGNATSHQGQVGISARMRFEVVIGEKAKSNLVLHNEGSAAIYYSWQQLALPHSFPAQLQARPTVSHFYFNSSRGVILPNDTQQVEFTFQSDVPGVKCELWQLNTHPVLLGGASMQVTLRGVALDRANSEHRLLIERELEKKVSVKFCQLLIYEAVRGVVTPERPSSPVDLTEDQEFLRKNPQLQYSHEPFEALKILWQKVTPGLCWDLSVETLRQVVLSLPEEDPDPVAAHCTLSRDQGLAQLNSLLLDLQQHRLKPPPITAATIGRQLWRGLLDRMAAEAMAIRPLLGLPETETWSQYQGVKEAPFLDKMKKEETEEKRGGTAAKERKRVGSAKERDDRRGVSKSQANVEERCTKKAQGADEATRCPGGKQGKELAKEPSLADASQGVKTNTLWDDAQHNIQTEVWHRYNTHLHQKVYVLMEDLVDDLCSIIDAL